MRKSFIWVSMMLLAACAPQSVPLPAPQTVEPLATAVVITPSAAPTTAAIPDTQIPAHTAIAPSANATRYTSGTLWLNLISPQDQEVVSTSQITLSGQAPPDTVVTINDQIIIVGTDQSFTTPIDLVEGPNVIELVASDVDGNEIDIVLTVIYDPQGGS